MKTHKFARKPFYVDAVRISEANIKEVAAWCDGEVCTDDGSTMYVKVRVHRPLTERQTQAFIGDWVLSTGSGYKVYTPRAFEKSFEKVRHLTKAQADEAGITVPHEPRTTVTQKGTNRTATIPTSEIPKPGPPKSAPEQSIKIVDEGAGVVTEIDTEANPPAVVPTVMPPRVKDDVDRFLENPAAG